MERCLRSKNLLAAGAVKGTSVSAHPVGGGERSLLAGPQPGFRKLVPKIGNCKICGHLLSRETALYSDFNHKHVFTY